MTKEQVLESKDSIDLIKFMVHNNAPQFNLNKALEEASEFMEAAIKLETKSKKNPKRPTEKDALGEYADFVMRGRIYVQMLFKDKTFEEVDEMINAHLVKKEEALFGYLENGKYDKGL